LGVLDVITTGHRNIETINYLGNIFFAFIFWLERAALQLLYSEYKTYSTYTGAVKTMTIYRGFVPRALISGHICNLKTVFFLNHTLRIVLVL
jgi:tellurite resistance protein TehA-like permease